MWPTRADAEGDTAGSALWAGRFGGATDEYLQGRQSAENFPVALKLLPGSVRTHLRNVYDVTRVIDDLGDEAPGDRSALLATFRADLETIWAGGVPITPVLRRLAPTVHACGLSRQPFVDLIEANLRDQTTFVYPTYRDLQSYCALSANPVGRMVLEVFGVSTPNRVALSDRVCTALQVIEHCQDVAEDRRAGRIYLPLADLDQFGVARSALDAGTTGPELRKLIAFEVERAEAELRAAGDPLIAGLRGWVRLAVGGYVAGGRAAVTALRRGGWAVQPTYPSVRKRDVLRELVAAWARAARPVWRKEVP